MGRLLSYSRALANTHPVAKQAQKARKVVGDNTFPVIADKMIEDVRTRRESRQNEKARMGSFNQDGSYNRPTTK